MKVYGHISVDCKFVAGSIEIFKTYREAEESYKNTEKVESYVDMMVSYEVDGTDFDEIKEKIETSSFGTYSWDIIYKKKLH